MSQLLKMKKPGRAEAIALTLSEALSEGKASGTYTCPSTGLEERWTYIRKQGKTELIEVWTNAEEVYPAFTDRKGRRIRY